MEPEKSAARVDLANLQKLSGGDKAFELKYMANFLNAVPEQLSRLETAMALRDGTLAYNILHRLKAQLKFYNIKAAVEELAAVEQKMGETRVINADVEKSINIIFKEITLACKEFETLKENTTKLL